MYSISIYDCRGLTNLRQILIIIELSYFYVLLHSSQLYTNREVKKFML